MKNTKYTPYIYGLFISVLMTSMLIGYDVVAEMNVPPYTAQDLRRAECLRDSLNSLCIKTSVETECDAWRAITSDAKFRKLESEIKTAIYQMNNRRNGDVINRADAMHRYFDLNEKMACLQDSLVRAYVQKSPEIMRIDSLFNAADAQYNHIKQEYACADSLRKIPRHIRFKNNCKKYMSEKFVQKTK